MDFVNIGFRNYVATDKIAIILANESAPIKRFVRDTKKDNELIDATFGRKAESVIILDCDKVVVSSLNPEKLLSKTEQ